MTGAAISFLNHTGGTASGGVVILPALIAGGMGTTTLYYNPFRTGAPFGASAGPELSVAPHRGGAGGAVTWRW